MKSDTLSILKATFQEHSVLWSGPVPRSEFDLLEKAAGFSLPADYREFVETFGGAIVGPFSVYGLRAAKAMGKNSSSAWTVTQRFRSQRWPGVESWLVISSDHAGNPVGIDKDGKVWISDHDARAIDLLATSFEGYLRQWCLKLKD